MKTVVIVEDHLALSEAIGRAICSVSDQRSTVVLDTYLEALLQLPVLAPDLVILDNRLEDGTGIDLVGRLRLVIPATRWLLYSGYASATTLRKAIANGIDGAVAKRSPLRVLLEAVDSILSGRRYFCDVVSKELHSTEGLLSESLTTTEKKIAGLVATGLEAKEIAAILGVAHKTVLNALVSIRKKTGLDSTVRISDYARECGLESAPARTPV